MFPLLTYLLATDNLATAFPTPIIYLMSWLTSALPFGSKSIDTEERQSELQRVVKLLIC